MKLPAARKYALEMVKGSRPGIILDDPVSNLNKITAAVMNARNVGPCIPIERELLDYIREVETGDSSMSKSRHGKIDGQFVPLLHATLDAPAWRVMSHGARSLYAALKRRVPRERNVAWVSYRDAIAELKSSKRKIADWFRELQHYGFIRLHSAGHLGVDGKGQSPHWRLTELGKTPRVSSDGLPESPTRDFLMWDGEMFKARVNTKWNDGARLGEHRTKKQNPGSRVGIGVVPASDTPPVPASDTPIPESGSRVVDIENEESGSRVVDISSLTTTGETQAPTPTTQPNSSEGSPEEENVLAHSDESNVVNFDERIATLEATEKKKRRSP